VSATPGTERAPTGDKAVDEVLSQLDRATGESLDRQIEVASMLMKSCKAALLISARSERGLSPASMLSWLPGAWPVPGARPATW